MTSTTGSVPAEGNTHRFKRGGAVGVLGYAFVAIGSWSELAFTRPWYALFGYAVLLVAVAASYLYCAWHVHGVRIRSLLQLGALVALLGFLCAPYDSTDAFFYVSQGWAQSHYQQNPYSSTLGDIPNVMSDPMIASRWMALNRNPWLDEPLPYGFLFAHLIAGIGLLGRGNLLFSVLLLKGIMLLAHLGNAALLWFITASHSPHRRKLALYLYLCSPLVVVHFLANAHNDLLMGFLVLAGFVCMRRGPVTAVLALLVAAGMIKYSAFALLPVAAVSIVRTRSRSVVIAGCGAAVATAMLLALKYVSAVPDSTHYEQILLQFSESAASVSFLLSSLIGALPSDSSGLLPSVVLIALQPFLWTLVALVVLSETVMASKGAQSDETVARAWLIVLATVVFIGSPQMYPWYIGALLPLAVFGVGRTAWGDLIVLLGCTHGIATSFLARRSVLYVVVATIIPLLLIWWHRARGRSWDKLWSS